MGLAALGFGGLTVYMNKADLLMGFTLKCALFTPWHWVLMMLCTLVCAILAYLQPVLALGQVGCT